MTVGPAERNMTSIREVNMAEESSKTRWANDSLTESFTHTRPDPATKAPTLKRGTQPNDRSARSEAPQEVPKKP